VDDPAHRVGYPASVLTCSQCGTANDPHRKFCLECGSRLVSGCPACGAANPPGAKFCGECGTNLTTSEAGSPDAGGGPRRAPQGSASADGVVTEVRLISVMFVDLVGFTPLSERLDAEEVRELLDGYFATARGMVGRHGGVIEKFIGDAVMAVWGTPVAHEDDAERAVRTALQLVEAVGRIEVDGVPLEGRAGVLTGEAVVTVGADGQWMVAGDLVNTAARLQSAAVPGTVLVGEATYRAASGAIAFEPVGEQSLKGKTAAVPGWQALAVVARLGGSGRSEMIEPPFVGRDEELRALKDHFHATEREGKPRLLTIVGQAGIGKTRLAWELEKYLDGVVETILWHEGRSPSYGDGISYWALAEIVRGRARIAESDEPDTARRRLGEMLDEMVPDLAERRWIEPRLTGLLGLDDLPVESREELFAAWRTFFERLAEKATTILIFWDLQWADQGLLDFIEHLLTWARSSPIFVLAEARPDLLERRPGWGAAVRSSTTIHLEPLSNEDMRLLLGGLVSGLPEHAMRAIVERAEGVPLYAVETLRMLIDRGVLEPTEDGDRFTLAVDLPELDVPATLHALIAARLDTLASQDRGLLMDASVLGLSFTVESVRALTDMDQPAVAASLDRLVRHQLLVLDSDPRSPERGQFRFVQGVVREVAYQALAKRDRRAKHIAAARHLESLGDDELAGVLANHYLAAFHASPAGPEADTLSAQARVALRAAAERAASLHSLIGAVGYLEQAVDVTKDPHELALIHERAAGLATEGGAIVRGREHIQEAQRIHSMLGDRLGVLRSRALEARIALAEHGDKLAIEILRAALADVADLPPSHEIALAWSELARALMLTADPEAIAWADKVLAEPKLVTPVEMVQAIITKATSQLNAGFLVESEVGLRGAIVVADRLGDPMAALRARNNLSGLINPTSIEATLVVLREIYEIGIRFGQRTWVNQAIGSGLASAFEVGRWDEWLEEMRDAEPEASEYYRLWFRGEMAHRMAYEGKTSEALAIADEILRSEAVRNSAQGSTGIDELTGEFAFLEGRWLDAYEIGRRGWTANEVQELALQLCSLAAAAAADLERTDEVIAAMSTNLVNEFPSTIALRQMGGTFKALLEGRWDDARNLFVVGSRTFEAVQNRRVKALFQLAVGHLAGDRFAEAGQGLREAEEFLEERGAGSVVAMYRAKAVIPAKSGRSAAPRSDGSSGRAMERADPVAG